MGLPAQVAHFVRTINRCSLFSVPEEVGGGKMVFLPKDICLCHSDRKSCWINQREKQNRWVRKPMAKEKTMRILYMSGLSLPFHKQTSSYFCISYLDILFLSLSPVWHWDFEKAWSQGKVSSMAYLKNVEIFLLKLRNVWRVIVDTTKNGNCKSSPNRRMERNISGKKKKLTTH